MKGPFSIWAFFGLTLWIDIISHIIKPRSQPRINPYDPVREVSFIIPIHKEPDEHIQKTIRGILNENYPIKNIFVCSDRQSNSIGIIESFYKEFNNIYYIVSPNASKAKKINYVVKNFHEALGDYIYIRDCRVIGTYNCTEKMISYFNSENVAAVTSFGKLLPPKNFLSRSYYYGKDWVNEIGRFRKKAQEKRKAVFVICGASTIIRKNILKNTPIPTNSKTEDTYYTWILQKIGYTIRIADDAVVYAPEIDGKKFKALGDQLRQSYRWSSGTIQCLYHEGKNIFRQKRLAFSTIIPGFLESLFYTVPLLLLPLLFFTFPYFAIGFLIGDTLFSLIGTVILIPKNFLKTVLHYPQIFFFKYLNGIIFIASIYVVTFQAVMGKTEKWQNEWQPLKTTGFFHN